MTFLNTALLAGLAAVALPILIHLFTRRRYPLIDFSTLKFLRKLQRHQMRRLKLRQWLLLALRCLAILMITLAFTRPALLGDLGIGSIGAGRISTILIVDGSASMQAKSHSRRAFEEAKNSCSDLLSLMNRGDQIAVIIAKQEPELILSGLTQDTTLLRKALRSASVWDGSADIDKALDAAQQLLTQSGSFRNEIFIMSDFNSVEDIPETAEDVSLNLIPIRTESIENLSIKSVNVISEIIEPKQPVEVEVTLANHGRKERKDIYYSIFLGGVRIGENVVTIAPDSEIKQVHQIIPEEYGMHVGMVQIEERDVFRADNRSAFCFRVPKELKVLLVGKEEDCQQIQMALVPKTDEFALFSVLKTPKKSWDTQSINSFNVIVFTDPPKFSNSQSSRLTKFVQNGGGLLILPGNGMEITSLNRDLLARLGTPKYSDKIGQVRKQNAFTTWQQPDLSASLFKGIFRTGNEPSLPRFFQAVQLTGGSSETSLSFKEGKPFLTETKKGRGRVILLASSPNQEWSDWAERGIYAPLMHRIILKLAGSSQEGCHSLTVGDPLEISAIGVPSMSANLRKPDGEEIQLAPQVSGQKISFLQPNLTQAGLYELDIGELKHLAAVRIPQKESQLIEFDNKDLRAIWAGNEVMIIEPENLIESVRKARYGKELWKALLYAVFIILLVESLLGKSYRRKKQGIN
ncbi:hypothetical protein CEE37_13825 [candidate division LCP-89 bacterium B3_LCP]|uniref:VWFA domain-containing protein n=1 Tax=candidate division LCP-89 bacterium B3_LCP TaxID=2012998 RepID=A0A532URM9_UNCL8|nr:MAG: hypothetical protein CEE37_13825 [candidate division LCP-89 bacterium B3_LCP]